MKKTISITLNGMVFNIEEDAYERLHSYLDSLKHHFNSANYGKDVVDDIESRVAEQFNDRIRDRKKESVGLAEVEDVIKTMGSVQDVAGESAKNEFSEKPTGRKQLFRNPDDQIIAGVSGGIASYFNIDPIIPRILFVIGAFAGGYGILLYVILWIVVPEAQTGAEKLIMKGDPVTIANLEDSLKEKQTNPKRFSVLRYFFREVFYLIGRFFRMLGPIVIAILGLLITGAAFVAVFGFTLLALIMLFNPESPFVDPTISQVFSGSHYVMLISSGFVAAIIPALTALLIGVSLVRRKNIFNKTLLATFTILWLAGALTFGTMATSAAPQIQAAVRSAEQQPNVSKELQVTEFSSVLAQSNQRVKILSGNEAKVIAYGREQELKHVQAHVTNGQLVIDQRRDDDDFQICFFCINKPVMIEVTVPVIDSVEANNVSRVEILGFKKLELLDLKAEHGSKITFNGQADNITMQLESVAEISLIGSGQRISANLSNASKLNAEDFSVINANIDAGNASKAEVTVTGRLDAEASGASQILYSGNPTELQIEESNVGKVSEK